MFIVYVQRYKEIRSSAVWIIGYFRHNYLRNRKTVTVGTDVHYTIRKFDLQLIKNK